VDAQLTNKNFGLLNYQLTPDKICKSPVPAASVTPLFATPSVKVEILLPLNAKPGRRKEL
jgi:hypothetical protein